MENKAPFSALEVSADELAYKVAVPRRLRGLLIQQRERFHKYLTALDKQEAVIESGTAEELSAHVELEEQIVNDIFSLQKVIKPLETMYHANHDANHADDIASLKAGLEDLKSQALTRSARNRELLSTRMEGVRTEITSLKNNPFTRASRSLYQHSGAASLIDIKG